MSAPAQADTGLALELERRLEAGELELPPLPEVAQRVLSLLGDPGASAASLASLVQRDAALASAILRGANSAAIGGAMTVVSVQQGVARLGMERVAEIALAVSLRSGLFAGPRYPALAAAAWRRSLATGLYAREIARELRRNVEIAFLCGLLWDVGTPLVLHSLSQLSRSDVQVDEATAQRLCECLGRTFAMAVVAPWKLPPPVAQSIEARESGQSGPSEGCVAALAQRLADLALAETETPGALLGDRDALALNVYPNTLEMLLSRAEAIRSELEANL